jgi:DNA polymerase I-like protein with 3'-5' exonuclease and polymerase domains
MKKISLRSMYIAPPGKVLVAADLSQAESWIVAYLSDEQSMKWSLNYSDIHTDSAAALFYPDNPCRHAWQKIEDDTRLCTSCDIKIIKPARYIGKRYNHASAYRMKYMRAAQVINKDSDKPPYVTVTLTESKLFSDRWHQRYNIKNWWADIENRLNSQGRTLTTVYGFRRTFYAAWGDELFKEATAFEPQSTVADHFNGAIQPEVGVKGGAIEIYRQLVVPYADHRIINQSHDSCIMEVPSSVGVEIGQRMMFLIKRPLIIRGEEFTIPTDGEIGERWGEMEPLKEAA